MPQSRLFGPVLLSNHTRGAETSRIATTKNGNVYEMLPQTFSMENLRMLKGTELADSSLVCIISRWKSEGRVEKIDKNKWVKIRGVG